MAAKKRLPLSVLLATIVINLHGYVQAQDLVPVNQRPVRLLLIGQKKDSHPKSTHEYIAGIQVIARLLQSQKQIQTVMIQADGPWPEGPELLDGADGVLIFLSEGGKWVVNDPSRLAAFQRLAKRGGGLSCLHWGMGTKDAAPIDDFVSLFGGCHGGPDRKYQYGDYQISTSNVPHPILNGISDFNIHDEFYYNLKFPMNRTKHTNLLYARIDNMDYPIAWAWQRPELGRSFGFSGLHFHENWKRPEYSRLVTQGILWTLNQPITDGGVENRHSATDLALPNE